MRNILSHTEFINEAANGRLDKSGLVPVKDPGADKPGNNFLNAVAAKAYAEMVKAAEADGVTWEIDNSYRDYGRQVEMAAKLGLYNQGGKAAVPGTSNHGWGSAVDLKTQGVPTWPKAFEWLKANAAKFGFNNIPREPWHWEHKASVEFAKSGKEDPNAGKAPEETVINPSLINRLIFALKKKGFNQVELDKIKTGKPS